MRPQREHSVRPPGFLGFALAISITSLFLASCSSDPQLEPDLVALNCGEPCGECLAGTFTCENGEQSCTYPSAQVDDDLIKNGLQAADTGDREVFYPENYEGNNRAKFLSALRAAAEVQGAVVLNKVYELDGTIRIPDNFMMTGGGLRRACAPVGTLISPAPTGTQCYSVDNTEGFVVGTGVALVKDSSYDGFVGKLEITRITESDSKICVANPLDEDIPAGTKITKTYPMIAGWETQLQGVVIDSMFFDGNARCNSVTHRWTENNTLAIRGENTIRDSVFYDMPSENITSCGATITNNLALDLHGSFVHKSCSPEHIATDYISDNYVENTNISGDEIMRHSEGLITFSNNAGYQRLSNNVFRHGMEGVFGNATSEDRDVAVSKDCYAHFPQLIEYFEGAEASTFSFDAELINVGPPVFY